MCTKRFFLISNFHTFYYFFSSSLVVKPILFTYYRFLRLLKLFTWDVEIVYRIMQVTTEDGTNESVELHALQLLSYAEAICLGINSKGYRLR